MKQAWKAIAGGTIAVLAAGIFALNPVQALVVSTTSAKISVGQSTTVNVTGVVGRVRTTLSTGAPFTASFRQAGSTAGTVTIRGSKAGSGTVTVADNSTTRVINVQVVGPMTVNVKTLTLSVGGSAQVELTNVFDPSQLTAVSSSKAVSVGAISANSVPATIAVSGVTAAKNVILTIRDSKTTLKVTVTVNAVSTVSMTGRLLASNCFQCHGTDAKGGFESLYRESASEILSEMREFQRETDQNDIMAAHAMGYTDAQLQAIATYIDTLG